MVDRAEGASYSVVCPHCGKTFEAELLMTASAAQPSGFKCKHCRLFVPFERAADRPQREQHS